MKLNFSQGCNLRHLHFIMGGVICDAKGCKNCMKNEANLQSAAKVGSRYLVLNLRAIRNDKKGIKFVLYVRSGSD